MRMRIGVDAISKRRLVILIYDRSWEIIRRRWMLFPCYEISRVNWFVTCWRIGGGFTIEWLREAKVFIEVIFLSE